MRVPFKGQKAHLARLQKLSGAQFERRIGQALFVGGDRIRVEAQTSITSGAVSGKNHVPSIAPNAPNNDTGVLANNIEVTQPEALIVEVSSNAPYSADLEQGTSKMEARPFMAPARDKKRAEVEELVVNVVKRLARGR